MKPHEFKDLVLKARNKQADFLIAAQNDSNPQVRDLCQQAAGKWHAYDAVLEAIVAERKSAAYALVIEAGQ